MTDSEESDSEKLTAMLDKLVKADIQLREGAKIVGDILELDESDERYWRAMDALALWHLELTGTL